jgi:hypothetical protein
MNLPVANIIGAFITFIKTYAGFGIIVVAAFVIFAILMVSDHRTNKHK